MRRWEDILILVRQINRAKVLGVTPKYLYDLADIDPRKYHEVCEQAREMGARYVRPRARQVVVNRLKETMSPDEAWDYVNENWESIEF